MSKLFQKFQDSLAEDGRKRAYYAAYTVLFWILACFVFSWCIFLGKSLIIDVDGWVQHFRALIYYAQYLRQIVRNLLTEHRLIIPDWNFYIGEGSDILNALHYYVVGDPIALLSVLIPTRFMHYFYSFSCVLRLYLAGLAFSALAFGTGCRNRYGIMAGALSYCFCAWEVIFVGYHPCFLNPCIYFPLVILGVEKILRKERPYLFILSVTLSAVCNFYFFYMIVLLTVGYTLIRIGTLYGKNLKNGVSVLLRIGAVSVVGACLAGVILLPVLAIFLQDSRFSPAARTFQLFYPLSHYINLPLVAISNYAQGDLTMGFSAPVILALFLLFSQKKRDHLLKILFGACLLIFLFPIFGHILNGMSYAANRWSWALALLCSYILVKEWDFLLCPTRSDWKKMLAGCLLFLFYSPRLLFASPDTIAAYFPALALLFLTLLLVRDAGSGGKTARKRQPLLLLIVCICAVNLGYTTYSPFGLNHAAKLTRNNKVSERLEDDETGVVKELSDVSYPRYSGRSITTNANMTNRISNTQYFWSVSNPYVNRFRSDMEMRESSYYDFEGYDDRTSLLSLSSVQYYVTDPADTLGMPYGYTPVNSGDDRYAVFKNQYALPLGYCYDSYVTRETWESLDTVQKQELQLEAAYVEGNLDGANPYIWQTFDYSVPYRLTFSGRGITGTETGFVTTAENTRVVLSFDGIENAETYLCLEGLEFAETLEYDLYSDDETIDPLNLYGKAEWERLSTSQQIRLKIAKMRGSPASAAKYITVESSEKVKRSLSYAAPNTTSSSGQNDYIINLGYREKPVTSIEITFLKRGVYTFKNLCVYSVSMDGYAEKIGALQRNTLQNIQLGTDEIRGELTIDMPKLLCMAIPYSLGWKASVDGTEASVMVVNERYLGVSVPAGAHTIEFRYSTPYKYAGLALSLTGAAAFAAVVLVTEKRRRSGNASNDNGKERHDE